ncbi:MAG: GIY-YIG nuclease family protein [bacterium]
MWHVYTLKSSVNKRLYTGYTEDLEQRIISHNSGKVRSTKSYRPYTLVYKESYNNKMEARKRELFLKSGVGRQYLKTVITD